MNPCRCCFHFWSFVITAVSFWNEPGRVCVYVWDFGWFCTQAWSCPLYSLTLHCSCINSNDGEEGCTPLHLACRKGDIDCIRELVEECHARVDLTDKNEDTVFHYAVRGSNPKIVEVRHGKEGVTFSLQGQRHRNHATIYSQRKWVQDFPNVGAK